MPSDYLRLYIPTNINHVFNSYPSRYQPLTQSLYSVLLPEITAFEHLCRDGCKVCSSDQGQAGAMGQP